MNSSEFVNSPLQKSVIIGFGGNIRDDSLTPSGFICGVTNKLVEHDIVVSKVSRPWASYAWPNKDHPMFVNAVVLAMTKLNPQDLLKRLFEIEKLFGRERSYKNAPRTLDLDLIAYENITLSSPSLTLPHPSAHERAFVMGPICDIDKRWMHPVLNQNAATLYENATIGCDAYPIVDDTWPSF